jgi:hypothetical protein
LLIRRKLLPKALADREDDRQEKYPKKRLACFL